MPEFHNLRGQLFNRPLMVLPARALEVASVLSDRASWSLLMQEAQANGVRLSERTRRRGQTFHETAGVAVIPVRGTLVQRNGLDPESGMTGYDGIARKLADAAEDPMIRAIVLQIDSPGGEVAGCFDLADQVHAARAEKPVWAILDENAASAAYALASQADRVTIPRTGAAGSIGVVCMHADFSRLLDTEGVTLTLIHAGAHKVDGNPYEPLPDAVRAEWQAELDETHRLFAELVSRGRGMTVEAVLATEAKVFTGSAARAAGLVDAVLAPEDAFQALLSALDGNPIRV
jgi:signal peptide peptidase SppA